MRAMVVSAVALAGCADFATPDQLAKPTVLAVIADPPLVGPGESSQLTVVMAGPDGPITPDAATWRIIESFPDVPTFGEVTAGGEVGVATFAAPDPVPALPENVPPLVSVEVTIEAAGTAVVAVKGMVVEDLPAANPVISALAVGDEVVADAAAMTAGQTYTLDVGIEPRAGDDAAYAWYTTAGTIERYQSNPTEIVADDDGDDGWLFVVVRDGRGGVAWKGVEVGVSAP